MPPGYVLKSQMKELLEAEAANKPAVEDEIEEARKAVEARTPLTHEVFDRWRADAAKAKVVVVYCLLIASLIRWSASLIRCKLRIRSRLRRSGTRQRHSTRSRTPALRRATRPT